MKKLLITACWILLALACAPAARAESSARIVGGSSAQIEDYPYQVAVLSPDGLCGGSIRDSTHVITAAHCVLDDSDSGYPEIVPPGNLLVVYGTDQDPTLAANGSDIDVASLAVDRRYLRRLSGAEYDSAVLTLDGAIPTTPTSAPIPLADPTADATFLEPGDPATVSGFGTTSFQGAPSEDLQAVQVDLVDDPTCGGRYGSQFVAAAMICAGDLADGGEDSCQGDSGGPLAVDTDPVSSSPADLRLAGIVSFGEECALAEFPGVYTEVNEAATRQFLLAQSPAPPSVSGEDPSITPATPQVGSTVTCSVNPTIGEATQYFFYALSSAGTATGLASGPSPTFTVPQAAAGQRLLCDVRVENAGGFSYATDQTPTAPVSAPPVTPVNPVTPPIVDRTRPRSRVTRIRCPGRVCIVSIRASDTKPGAIRSLSVVLSHSRTTCRGRGARRTCRTDRFRKKLRAGALGGGKYRVVTGRLAPRRYRITVRAVDTSGNKQLRAASRLFRVKPSR